MDKEQEAFLKLWYSKHEVALKYIAICEEKRPLQQSRSDGHESNLGQSQSDFSPSSIQLRFTTVLFTLIVGHKGKTNLLVALRKHATQLKKIVETYRTRRQQYHIQYPNHQLPEDIDYIDLLNIQADHPFWNDSLFTQIEAPWAVDPNTREGM